MSLFVLSVICDHNTQAQHLCVQQNLLMLCTLHLEHLDSMVRRFTPRLLLRVISEDLNMCGVSRWACFTLGKVWEDNPEAKMWGLRQGVPQRLVSIVSDPIPEVPWFAFTFGCVLR